MKLLHSKYRLSSSKIIEFLSKLKVQKLSVNTELDSIVIG